MGYRVFKPKGASESDISRKRARPFQNQLCHPARTNPASPCSSAQLGASKTTMTETAQQ